MNVPTALWLRSCPHTHTHTHTPATCNFATEAREAQLNTHYDYRSSGLYLHTQPGTVRVCLRACTCTCAVWTETALTDKVKISIQFCVAFIPFELYPWPLTPFYQKVPQDVQKAAKTWTWVLPWQLHYYDCYYYD